MSKEPESLIQVPEDIEAFRELGKIPVEVELVSPVSLRPDTCTNEYFVMYEYPFRIGFSWPFSPLVRSFLQEFNLSPGQLMPQSWRIIYVIERVTAEWKSPFRLNDLLVAYQAKFDKYHRYSLFSRNKGDRVLVQKSAVNDRGWKSRYVFGRLAILDDEDQWLVSGWNVDVIDFSEVEPLRDSQARIERFLQYSVYDRSFYRTTVEEEGDDDVVIEVDSAGIATRRREESRGEEEGDEEEEEEEESVGKKIARGSRMKAAPERLEGKSNWLLPERVEKRQRGKLPRPQGRG